MSKTITLRLSDEIYGQLAKYAESDNRTISNFIETAARRYVEQEITVDEYEMKEILSNRELLKSLQRAEDDIRRRKVRRVTVRHLRNKGV